jgi:hypothetical protein
MDQRHRWPGFGFVFALLISLVMWVLATLVMIRAFTQ